MDIKRTKQYYKQLSSHDLCDCAYCQLFHKDMPPYIVFSTALITAMILDANSIRFNSYFPPYQFLNNSYFSM